MPQPVHYSDHIEFYFTPDALLSRPKLAAHIATISMQWNEIDTRITTMLAALLGGEAKTGISMFLSITSDGAKRAVLDTVCNLKLPTTNKRQLQELLTKISDRYEDRNRVVHGAWGVSPKYPDALLWSDVKNAIFLHVDMMALQGPQNKTARDARLLAYQKSLKVWKERDFLDVEKRIQDVFDELIAFTTPIILSAFGPHARSVPPKSPIPPR